MAGGDPGLQRVLDRAPHHRHQRRAADEHDARQLIDTQPVLAEQPQADVDGALHERRAQLLERRAIERHVHLDLAAVDHQRCLESERGLLDPAELDLPGFRHPAQRCERRCMRGLLAPRNLLALRRELLDDPVDDRAVEVATAEEVVAVVADHAQQAIARLEERDVERAAAEVVHHPCAGLVGRPPRRERRRDRLLQQLDVLEAGELRGRRGGLVLRQLEQRRHRDHRARRQYARQIFHVLAQRLEHQRAELLGRLGQARSGEGDLLRHSHQALELAARVLRIALRRRGRLLPDADAPLPIDPHHRGRQVRAIAVADHAHLIAIEHGSRRVGRSEIDAREQRPGWRVGHGPANLMRSPAGCNEQIESSIQRLR